MRVLVLVPTTGKLNRVLRIDPYPDLVHSFVVRQGDVERLPITRKYADLTSQGGPLAALGPPVKPGLYRLLLAGPIEAGDSWQLPVLLAHLAVALGEKLAEEPAEGDIVLWSTGAVDVDLNVVDHDYRLPAKVACSRTALQQAAAAGAQIVAILPACAREDAPSLHDMLAEIGAQHARVETVDSVVTARGILEQALGRPPPGTMDPAPLLPVEPVPKRADDTADNRGLFWKVPALLASGAAMALAAFIVGNQWLPPLIPHGIRGAAAPRINKIGPPAEPPRMEADRSRATDELPPNPDAPRESDVAPPSRPPDILPAFKPPESSPDTVPSPRPEVLPSPPEIPPVKTQSPPPVPVRLQELRAANNGTCIPYIVERRTPPWAIDVALDATDHFRDSAGRNLCGLEWSLTPEAAQSGVQGFDVVDLAADRYGARLDRSGGAPGASTRIRIEFTRDFRNTNPITYNVRLKFAGAPPPEQVQQFKHAVR
jgi:hypothetical protein